MQLREQIIAEKGTVKGPPAQSSPLRAPVTNRWGQRKPSQGKDEIYLG